MRWAGRVLSGHVQLSAQAHSVVFCSRPLGLSHAGGPREANRAKQIHEAADDNQVDRPSWKLLRCAAPLSGLAQIVILRATGSECQTRPSYGLGFTGAF